MEREDSPIPLPLGTSLFGFEIIEKLGSGGFGIVYRARRSHLDGVVAIKEFLPGDLARRTAKGVVVPRPSKQEDFAWALERFLAEAKTLSQLAKPEPHPNLIQIEHVFEANDTAYFSMKYEEGEPFDAVLKRDGRWTEDRLRTLFFALLDGLEHVHNAKVLHRDIKPSNILIRPDRSPVLIDFGAARRDAGDTNRTRHVFYTPGFAPPEQLGGESGPWTDIYSLAATIYFALTGEKPNPAKRRLLADELAEEYDKRFLNGLDAALDPHYWLRPATVAQWRDLFDGVARTVPAKLPETGEADGVPHDPDVTVFRPRPSAAPQDTHGEATRPLPTRSHDPGHVPDPAPSAPLNSTVLYPYTGPAGGSGTSAAPVITATPSLEADGTRIVARSATPAPVPELPLKRARQPKRWPKALAGAAAIGLAGLLIYSLLPLLLDSGALGPTADAPIAPSPAAVAEGPKPADDASASAVAPFPAPFPDDYPEDAAPALPDSVMGTSAEPPASTDIAVVVPPDHSESPEWPAPDTQIASQPRPPLIERIGAALAHYDCASLAVEPLAGGRYSVSGHVATAADRDRLRGTLEELAAGGIDIEGVEVIEAPLCKVLALATAHTSDVAPRLDLNRPEGQYRLGDPFSVSLYNRDTRSGRASLFYIDSLGTVDRLLQPEGKMLYVDGTITESGFWIEGTPGNDLLLAVWCNGSPFPADLAESMPIDVFLATLEEALADPGTSCSLSSALIRIAAAAESPH